MGIDQHRDAPSANRRALYQERVGSTLTTPGRAGGAPREYRIDRLLGWGSTSAVYEASDSANRRFAIKILHASLWTNDTVVQRFLREAYVANTIDHPSIVTVRNHGTIEGLAYLVLDLLDGETLEDRRLSRGGKLPLAEVAPLALVLMSACSAVHRMGVVHRDLKPQNVFLTTNSELKVLDFGTARIRDAEGAESLSIEGLVIGTPSFMSPEQALGQRGAIDARSDVWSLGATLFTILSGEYVHVGRDAHQRLLAAATRPARSLATVAPSLDPGLVHVVDRALAFDRAERWADVDSMRAAFEASLADSV